MPMNDYELISDIMIRYIFTMIIQFIQDYQLFHKYFYWDIILHDFPLANQTMTIFNLINLISMNWITDYHKYELNYYENILSYNWNSHEY